MQPGTPEPTAHRAAGVLFVDDEPHEVRIVSRVLADALGTPVGVAGTVADAVRMLHERPWLCVVMDVFVPLGDHPHRVLGPRARRWQQQVEHLGGLVLLEEIERLERPPLVLCHTACTDHVLLEIFDGRVEGRLPKPAPVDVLLDRLRDLLAPA